MIPGEHRIEPAEARRISEACRQCRRQTVDAISNLPDGWQIAPYDPADMLRCCSHLRMKPGFRLVAYQLIAGQNGNGFIFAVPEEVDMPEPLGYDLWLSWGSLSEAILRGAEEALPGWMHADFEEFLITDGTSDAWFEASIVSRELRELGSLWHGCSWSTHRLILTADELELVLRENGRDWTWDKDRPEDWRPCVRCGGRSRPQVEFFTHTGLALEAIYHHRDRFGKGCKYKSEVNRVATCGRGYVF